jgi:hypothetical protein
MEKRMNAQIAIGRMQMVHEAIVPWKVFPASDAAGTADTIF